MNARKYPPHERLHISNHAYSPKHVNNIAQYLANTHSVQLPYGFPHVAQNDVAYWIIEKFCHDYSLIATAERIVRNNYGDKTKIYRKGRPIGSKNKNSYMTDPSSDALDALLGDDAPQATEPASDAATGVTPQISQPSVDLSAYALKRELHDVAASITNALKPYCESNFRNVAQDHRILSEVVAKLYDKINNITDNRPTIVTLERRELPALEFGVQHKHFPDLLAMCLSRVNVWLFGPAGTGKTTAAKMVAKALNLPFYMQSAMETGFQVLGYCDAHGNYVTTLFRQCWEFGGVIILDEQDSYSPSATLALNGALANGFCAFADKIVPRHPDCIIIAGANTTGLGGTLEYSGRAKLDAAYLDRFVMLDWPIDFALEDHLCPNKPWLAIVRAVRNNIVAKQIKGAMATPRASIYGSIMLHQSVSLDRVMRSTLRKGMTDAQWDMVKPSVELVFDCIPVVKVEQISE